MQIVVRDQSDSEKYFGFVFFYQPDICIRMSGIRIGIVSVFGDRHSAKRPRQPVRLIGYYKIQLDVLINAMFTRKGAQSLEPSIKSSAKHLSKF